MKDFSGAGLHLKMAGKNDDAAGFEAVLLMEDFTDQSDGLFTPSVSEQQPRNNGGNDDRSNLRITVFCDKIRIDFDEISQDEEETQYAVWYRSAHGTFLKRAIPKPDVSDKCVIKKLSPGNHYEIFIVKYISDRKESVKKHPVTTKCI